MRKLPHCFPQPGKAAFTLTELLISIAVILILSGLLLPVASKAFAKSRQVVCVNNMRQIITGWHEWGKNRRSGSIAGESSPLCLRAQDSNGTTWAEVLSENHSSEVLKCPEQENDSPDAYGYGLNPLCGGIWYYPSRTISAGFLLLPENNKIPFYNLLINPSKTVVLCDSGYITDSTINLTPANWEEDGAKPWKPYVAFSLTGPSPDPEYYSSDYAPNLGYDWGNADSISGVGDMGWDQHYRAVPRHPRVSTGFADGHVESLDIESLTEPQWGTPDCLYDNQPRHNPFN